MTAASLTLFDFCSPRPVSCCISLNVNFRKPCLINMYVILQNEISAVPRTWSHVGVQLHNTNHDIFNFKEGNYF